MASTFAYVYTLGFNLGVIFRKIVKEKKEKKQNTN